MALPFTIAPTQTDAKSPIDAQLMDSIRENLDYLDAQLGGSSGGGQVDFRINGLLSKIKLGTAGAKKLDGAVVPETTTYSKAKLYQKLGGTSGTTEVDVLRSIAVNHPVISIQPVYAGFTQSIGRLGSSLPTQSIATATPTVGTLLIDYAKATNNIRAIIPYGDDRYLVTFTGNVLLDGDYKVGDTIIVAGAVDGNNNGRFLIEEINSAGLPSVVVTNPLGVQQDVTGGTGELAMFEYVVASAVDANFTIGEEVILTGHDNVVNDGTFIIENTNQAGNNLWVKNALGELQGGANGTLQTSRFIYNYGAIVDDTQYVIGESAEFLTHTDANNNGKFEIVAVNTSGSDITVRNPLGVSQAGAAGTVDTLRWVYALGSDPTAEILIGSFINMVGHDDVNNDGDFEVKNMNRFGSNDIEVFNLDGVAQAGINGLAISDLKVVEFDNDYSADYLVNKSKVILEEVTVEGDITNEFDVVEINRGVSATNIVIDALGIGLQIGPAGRVSLEARSIFIDKPSITVTSENSIRNYQLDTSATFEAGQVPADAILTLDVTNVQAGKPYDLVLSLL